MKIEIFTHGTKDYIISIGKNKEENWQLIDASDPNTSSWPRLINRCNSGQKANVSFEAFVNPDDSKDFRVVIQANKDIHKNHQILADYKM